MKTNLVSERLDPKVRLETMLAWFFYKKNERDLHPDDLAWALDGEALLKELTSARKVVEAAKRLSDAYGGEDGTIVYVDAMDKALAEYNKVISDE